MWHPAEQRHPRSLSLSGLLGRAARYESLPAPVDRRLRTLAWSGTLLLAAVMIFLAVAPRYLDPGGRHAGFLLVGRDLFVAVLHAAGRADVVLPAGWAALAAAMVLAVTTSGFRQARRWQQFALLAVGLLGTGPSSRWWSHSSSRPSTGDLAAVLGIALAGAREVIVALFEG